MVKAIQILSMFRDKLARDTVSTIVNNMHHGSLLVREEAAKFMLEVCSELTDLLPVQKVTEDDKDFAINFYQEPKQSKRQLITLIQIVGERVKSRVEYLKLVKMADPDIYISEASNQQPITLAEE
jgi:hypothetical protein